MLLPNPVFNIDPTGADASCGIYALRRVDKPEVYVGQSKSLYERLRDHRKRLRAGTHRNKHMQAVFDKTGVMLTTEILAVGFDPKDTHMLALAEQEFMDAVPSGLLNMLPAMRHGDEYSPSADTRAKISAAGKGRPRSPNYPSTSEAIIAGRIACGLKKRGMISPFKGQKHTAETRAHISQVRQAQIAAGMPSGFKGRKHSPEALAQLSAQRKGRTSPNKGVPRTAEQKAKQSATMKKLHASPEYREKMRVLNACPERQAMRSDRSRKAWITRKAAMETE